MIMVRQLIAPVYKRLNLLRHPAVLPYLAAGLIATFTFGLLARFDQYLSTLTAVWHLSALLATATGFGILLSCLLERNFFPVQHPVRQSLFLLTVVAWGMVVFALLSPYLGWHKSETIYLKVYWPALGVAALPWFFGSAVKALAEVPQLRFAPFAFDSLKDVIAAICFAEDETKGIRWVFENDFYEVESSGSYDFRTFLPKDLKQHTLAKLFKSVISLHNITECPQQPIDFKNGKDAYGWAFYDYPYWFWRQRRRYLDPDKFMRRGRFHFRKLSERERARSVVKLVPGFRAASIYVTRIKITAP